MPSRSRRHAASADHEPENVPGACRDRRRAADAGAARRGARGLYAAESVDDFRLTGLAIVERSLGNEAARRREAGDRLVADLGDRVLYQQGQVYAQWGERVRALDRLEQARRVGDSGLIYARNDPLLDSLRDEPRFAQLLHSIGFA